MGDANSYDENDDEMGEENPRASDDVDKADPQSSSEISQAVEATLNYLLSKDDPQSPGNHLKNNGSSLPQGPDTRIASEVRTVIARKQRFKGPLPPPGLLREYQAIDSGLPREILDLTKREQAHRHKMETGVLDLENREFESKSKQVSRGQWLGFSVLIVVLAVAVLFAMLGFQAIAAIVAGFDVVALVGLFVTGQRAAKEKSQRFDPEKVPKDNDPGGKAIN